MPTYSYKAFDESGMIVTGDFEASNYGEALDYLQTSLEYTPIKVTEKKESALSVFLRRFQKVPVEEVMNFTKQLQTLEHAGVPVLTSISALREQADSPAFKAVLESVYHDLESGLSFSESLSKHPDVFPEFYIHSVKAGEEAGALEEVLNKLNEQLGRQADITRRIKKALRYPMMVMTAIVIAFVVIITFVLPNFIKMFAMGGQAELPLPTRILIGISDAFQNYWWLIFGSIVLIGFSFNYYIHTKQGRYNWDKFKIHMMVFGKLFHMVSIARFASTLQTLNKSGLPILQSLEIGAKSTGNKVIEKAIQEIAVGVKQGQGLTIPFRKSKMFPPLVIQMISVGEESGSLDEMLVNVAEHYDTLVNSAVDGLMTAIEPIMTVIIGSLVALLAAGMFMPMWGMIEAFQGASPGAG
ncbi:MAG: type II secretion system F family protein [Candidatus Neomarinimicrobiota bacterium]|nr:MAG: type II secretion system F family protein [Candidatus Neomarinimicrobiota bacterium]